MEYSSKTCKIERCSIRFRQRQSVVYCHERGHEALLDLPADHHQPLLRAVGAKLGLREVGLEAAEVILDFDPPALEVPFRFGLRARNPLVDLNLHPRDARIGFALRAR